MINIELSEGISETLDILSHMEKVYVNKIPQNFMNFLENNRSKSYICHLNHSKKLSEMNLKESTKNILTTIYIYYWADSKEKLYYNNLLIENENKYQEELRKKYKPDNLFQVKKQVFNATSDSSRDLSMAEYREPLYKKFINKIKKIFSR